MPHTPNPFLLWWWNRRIARMRRCTTTDELIHRFGEPTCRDGEANLEIWHYPLRHHAGFAWSIHVALLDGQPQQAYLHMTPSEASS